MKYYDPVERAKEKEASRRQDEEDLASGKKSQEQLRKENSFFGGMKFKIDFKAVYGEPKLRELGVDVDESENWRYPDYPHEWELTVKDMFSSLPDEHSLPKLVEKVKNKLPEAKISVDAPDATSVVKIWWVDFYYKDHHVVIEWENSYTKLKIYYSTDSYISKLEFYAIEDCGIASQRIVEILENGK